MKKNEKVDWESTLNQMKKANESPESLHSKKKTKSNRSKVELGVDTESNEKNKQVIGRRH